MAFLPSRKVRVLFSDIDGTLVHVAEDLSHLGIISDYGTTFFPNATSHEIGAGMAIRQLLPSTSGMHGYISERTLELVADMRHGGVKVILVTGARVSTLLERLPFLPACDAYVAENGGRIFLPDPVQPVGRQPLTAAPVVEDLSWRASHTAAGPIMDSMRPPSERSGELWDLYRRLEQDGWRCDAQRYTTDFRVRSSREVELQAVVAGLPLTLTASSNLGGIDFYPATSGKDHAAEYLMRKFGTDAKHSVSMGDDHNDLALASVVRHTYITSFSHPAVKAAVEQDPASFSVASRHGFQATEELLELIASDFGVMPRLGLALEVARLLPVAAATLTCLLITRSMVRMQHRRPL